MAWKSLQLWHRHKQYGINWSSFYTPFSYTNSLDTKKQNQKNNSTTSSRHSCVQKRHNVSDSPRSILLRPGAFGARERMSFDWLARQGGSAQSQPSRMIHCKSSQKNTPPEGASLHDIFCFWEGMQQRKRRNIKIPDFKQYASRKVQFLACPKTKTQQWPWSDVVEKCVYVCVICPSNHGWVAKKKCGPAITQHLSIYSDSIVGRHNWRKWRYQTSQLYIRVHLHHTFLMPCSHDCQD